MRRIATLLIAAGVLLGAPGIAHASRNSHHRDRHQHHREYRDDGYGDDGYWEYRDDGYRYQGRDEDGGYSYRHQRDRNGNEGDCQSGGCGNKSERCERSSGDCRSSFSPGPFKDSPVTIAPCMPGATCNYGDGQGDGSKSPPRQPEPKSRGLLSGLLGTGRGYRENTAPDCLIGVPFHCDQKPRW